MVMVEGLTDGTVDKRCEVGSLEWYRAEFCRYYQGARKERKIDKNLKRDLEWGWLLPYLFELDLYSLGRWDYWGRAMEAGRLLDEPIPEVWFGGMHKPHGMNHLENCLDLIPGWGSWKTWGNWQYIDFFFSWLLYGFGYHGQPELPKEPRGCEGASMRLYQYFDLGVLLAYPYEYWGDILSENQHGRNRGFYPTPCEVVELMCRMTFEGGHDFESGDHRTESVCDPCVGTGRMLLSASNYSFRLFGQDIDETVARATIINGYLYAPWLVKPFPFLDVLDDDSMATLSESLTVATQGNEDAQTYLSDTEHDAEQQWKFAPIAKRKKRKKGEEEKVEPAEVVEQGLLF